MSAAVEFTYDAAFSEVRVSMPCSLCSCSGHDDGWCAECDGVGRVAYASTDDAFAQHWTTALAQLSPAARRDMERQLAAEERALAEYALSEWECSDAGGCGQRYTIEAASVLNGRCRSCRQPLRRRAVNDNAGRQETKP